mmetsp:Transcript_19510/g.49931  ORF Transcript_19510/g.49931 Transcript_19510/m.49931 type:complete len:171 (+) Transcript_19510:81-593(+)
MGCNSGKPSAAAPAADAGIAEIAKAPSQTLLGNETRGMAKDQKPAAAQPAEAHAATAADMGERVGAAPSAIASLALEAAGGLRASEAAHAEMAKVTMLEEKIMRTEEEQASPASATVIQRCRRRKATPWVSKSQLDAEEEPTGLELAQNWLTGTCCGAQPQEDELERTSP